MVVEVVVVMVVVAMVVVVTEVVGLVDVEVTEEVWVVVVV